MACLCLTLLGQFFRFFVSAVFIKLPLLSFSLVTVVATTRLRLLSSESLCVTSLNVAFSNLGNTFPSSSHTYTLSLEKITSKARMRIPQLFITLGVFILLSVALLSSYAHANPMAPALLIEPDDESSSSESPSARWDSGSSDSEAGFGHAYRRDRSNGYPYVSNRQNRQPASYNTLARSHREPSRALRPPTRRYTSASTGSRNNDGNNLHTSNALTGASRRRRPHRPPRHPFSDSSSSQSGSDDDTIIERPLREGEYPRGQAPSLQLNIDDAPSIPLVIPGQLSEYSGTDSGSESDNRNPRSLPPGAHRDYIGRISSNMYARNNRPPTPLPPTWDSDSDSSRTSQ
ncbi:hypothetical protein EX30DRAFT_363862 [Ascodesmis nigricans]|uniref:Uncharacterized protein n=1 Tax=Ascodesmis nigricans TaxID=341454 RepID=A0A4S2MY73_9PEZI|nr:hypothetical protein EX30DRAFT_363862 [Ascodesmis nigricans]